MIKKLLKLRFSILIPIIRVHFGLKLRNKKLRRLKKKLLNKDFTLFTENCLAGSIYHDLGIQFKSPLINGEFSTEDYIKFLQNPQYYMSQELSFVSKVDYHKLPDFYKEINCPVACIGDLHYRFTHYKQSIEEIQTIWQRRKNRINWNSIFVILCEKKGCTLKHMQEFEKLNYPNKLILTCHLYPQLAHAFQIKGYEEIGYLDNLLKETPGIFPNKKKYYDQFDFVSWLNANIIKKS